MEPRPVRCIIDTDPGVDDVVALLLALSSPELLVVGITLTHGNCSLESSEKNLAKVFYALEQHFNHSAREEDKVERWKGVRDKDWRTKWGAAETIKVWKGSQGPIQGQAVTAKYFHGQDGLADCETLYPELTPPSAWKSPYLTLCPEPATKGITDLVKSRQARRQDKLAYIALGPLTSLAQLEPSLNLSSCFEPILSMGGAVQHPGNTTPVAEFNYYADPWSARTIFSLSLSNLYIFPLDLTSYLDLPFSLYSTKIDPSFSSSSSSSNELEEEEDCRDPLVRFTSKFLKGTERVMKSFGGDSLELHDPTVVFALIQRARSRRQRTLLNQKEEEEEEEDGDERETDRTSRREEGGGEFAPGWEWKRVDFEIECDGTLTRGMLVLDHRTSSKTLTSISSKTGQTNRTLAIEQVEREEEARAKVVEVEEEEDGRSSTSRQVLALDVPEIEARRAEMKKEARAERGGGGNKVVSGARVIVSSPGSEAMRKELLERVWGVKTE